MPLVWFLLGPDASPVRSFGRTRANTYHTQSASERESAGDSDHGSSVSPVRVSLQPLDSARAEKTVGTCTIYEPWRCMSIQHRATTSTSMPRALDHRSLLYYPLASSQPTCIYQACSFLTRTYALLYGTSHVHKSIIFSFHSASVTLSPSCILSRVDMYIHPSRPLLSVH